MLLFPISPGFTKLFALFDRPQSAQTVNFGSEMVKAKHVSGKNIFCSTNKDKIGEETIFEIVHFPLEG